MKTYLTYLQGILILSALVLATADWYASSYKFKSYTDYTKQFYTCDAILKHDYHSICIVDTLSFRFENCSEPIDVEQYKFIKCNDSYLEFSK